MYDSVRIIFLVTTTFWHFLGVCVIFLEFDFNEQLTLCTDFFTLFQDASVSFFVLR